MTEQNILEVAQEAWAAWNSHDVNRWVGLLAEEFVRESDTFPEPIRGREQAGEMMRMYLRAFPDLRFTIEQMVVSGDYVITRWKSSGTQKGELMGILPSGRVAEVHGCEVNEVKNGRITRDWSYRDTGTVMRQLGVLPGS